MKLKNIKVTLIILLMVVISYPFKGYEATSKSTLIAQRISNNTCKVEKVFKFPNNDYNCLVEMNISTGKNTYVCSPIVQNSKAKSPCEKYIKNGRTCIGGEGEPLVFDGEFDLKEKKCPNTLYVYAIPSGYNAGKRTTLYTFEFSDKKITHGNSDYKHELTVVKPVPSDKKNCAEKLLIPNINSYLDALDLKIAEGYDEASAAVLSKMEDMNNTYDKYYTMYKDEASDCEKTALKAKLDEYKLEIEDYDKRADVKMKDKFPNEYRKFQTEMNKFKQSFTLYNKRLDINNEVDCTSIFHPDLDKEIKLIWGWVQIAAPIMLIFFGSVDFGKAVIVEDNDALKKATSNFIKRAIATLMVFFIPMLIRIAIGIFNTALDGDAKIEFCMFNTIIKNEVNING